MLKREARYVDLKTSDIEKYLNARCAPIRYALSFLLAIALALRL